MEQAVVIKGIRVELKSTFVKPYTFEVEAHWDSGPKGWARYDFEFDSTRSHALALEKAQAELGDMLPDPDIPVQPREADVHWESFGEPRSGTGRSV